MKRRVTRDVIYLSGEGGDILNVRPDAPEPDPESPEAFVRAVHLAEHGPGFVDLFLDIT